MTSNYTKIFSLEVFHTYFADGRCHDIYFHPGPATRVIFKRFDFKVDLFENGLTVYVNTTSPVDQLLNYIAKVTGFDCIDYVIRTKDENFYLYTNRSIDKTWQLLFDSQTATAKPGGNALELSGTYLHDQSEAGVARVVIRFSDVCSHIPSGSNNANFSINYEARATQWQYYIINSSRISFNNVAIRSKYDIDFAGPSSVTMANGQAALLFTCQEPLELSNTVKYKFDLVSQSGSNGGSSKVIYKDLPNPNPAQMAGAVSGNSNQLVSPIYVYI